MIKRKPKQLPKGFLIVQIDGLGREALIRAIRLRKAPFLRNLLRGRHQGGYFLQRLNPGLPSTTPTVQAELLYGTARAFPGFRYIRRRDGQTIYFGRLGQVSDLEDELFADTPGILRGNGSSYFNIFHGGADRTRFSSSGLGKGELWLSTRRRRRALWNLARVLITTIPFLLWLFLVEISYEFFDMVRAFWKRKIYSGQVSFLLRGLIRTIGDELGLAVLYDDLSHGRQHVMVNLIGYDKAAHLRGPDHPHALRSIRQTDRLVKHLWRAAKRSKHVDYDFFLFSDHGMTPSKPVAKDAGQELQSLLRNEFSARAEAMGILQPNLWLKSTGSFGHIYLSRKEAPWRHELVIDALPGMDAFFARLKYVGAWVTRKADGRLRYCSKDASMAEDDRFITTELIEDMPATWGSLEPALVRDLFAISRHPDSGDVLLFGARDGDRVWNFLWEYGCHGAWEPEEQDAFLIQSSHLGPSPRDGEAVTPIAMNSFFERHYFQSKPGD